MIFCTSCGKQKSDTAKFCPNCGAAPAVATPPAEILPAATPNIDTSTAPPTETSSIDTFTTAPTETSSIDTFTAPQTETSSIDTFTAPPTETNDHAADSYGSSKKLIAIIAGVAALLIIGIVTVVANPGGIFRNTSDPAEVIATVTDDDTNNDTVPAQGNVVTDIIENITESIDTIIEEIIVPRPEPPLAQAFETLASESARRIEGSPFHVLSLLLQSLESGTTNIGVSQGGTFGFGVELALLSNLHEDEFLLQAAVNAMGVLRVETDLHVTYDSLAIRVPLFDDNFYGIRLSTLERDLQVFGDVFGLPEEITEMFASFSEMMEAAAELEEIDYEEFLTPYMDVLSRFLNNLVLTAEDTNLAGVSVTRYEYVVTLEDLIALLRDLYATIAADENLRAIFEFYDNPMFYEEFGIDYSEVFEDLLEELEWAIEELEFELEFMSFSINIAFYISDASRLMQITVGGEMAFDDEVEEFPFDIVINLGTSVYDTWSFYVTGEFPEDSVRVYWYFLDDFTGYENSIFVHTTDFWGTEEVYHLYTVWRPSTGRFHLRMTDGIWIDESFVGNFLRDDSGNFTFEFTVADFDVIISGTPGIADIPYINFINIDQWDEELIDQVEAFIFEFMTLIDGF